MVLFLSGGLAGIFLTAPLVWISALLSRQGLKILEDTGDWKRHWKILLSRKGNNICICSSPQRITAKMSVDNKSNQGD